MAQYIDAITCTSDGQVRVRTCELGVVPGAIEALWDPSLAAAEPLPQSGNAVPATPRHRARLRVADTDFVGAEARSAVENAASPRRFAGLAEDCFWGDVLQIPVKLTWPQANAAAVATKKKEGWTYPMLEEEFHKPAPRTAARHDRSSSVRR